MNLPDLSKIPPFDRDKAINYLKQWEALCEADGGKLWGVNLRTPFVIIDEATREAISNEPDFKGYPDDLPVSATGLEFDGKFWGTAPWHVFELIFTDGKKRMGLFAHEAFHALQPSLFGKTDKITANNSHLQEFDARVLAFVEMDALLLAIKSEGKKRTRAAQAALCARAKRHKKYGIMSEVAEEMNEGTAVYTEFMIHGFAELITELEDRVTKWKHEADLPAIFGYTSGALYCALLDTLGADWKRDLRYDTDLGEVLANTIGKAEIDLDEYGYQEILAAEEITRAAKEKALNDIKQAFSTRPLLRCFLKGDRAISGRMIQIAEFGKIMRGAVQYIGEFGKMAVNKNDVVKAIQAGGELDFLIHDDGHCAVFAENLRIEGSKVHGNYWELELNDGYEVVADGNNFEIKEQQR
ncbi:MAG: hypothetical protein FWE34_05365 [Defluviitaleaceae bacterium]|nr:hypothetical protein [Defluviitaleaceae bacterium]